MTNKPRVFERDDGALLCASCTAKSDRATQPYVPPLNQPLSPWQRCHACARGLMPPCGHSTCGDACTLEDDMAHLRSGVGGETRAMSDGRRPAVDAPHKFRGLDDALRVQVRHLKHEADHAVDFEARVALAGAATNLELLLTDWALHLHDEHTCGAQCPFAK